MSGVYNISSSLNFLDSLAKGVTLRFGEELENVTIFLPNRRAARPLAEAFLKASGNETLLLPKIEVIGDVDEDELHLKYFPDFEKIPPAIPSTERLYAMARFINTREGMQNFKPDFAQSIALAKSLIRLIDELQNKDLGLDALTNVVPEEFAEHWQITVDFLKIISEDWQNFLQLRGVIEPITRRNRLIGKLADYYRESKPQSPVIIAGTTGTIPATVGLIKAVLDLPQGYLVLDGMDRNLPAENFKTLEETHPQYNLSRLIHNLKREPADVVEWEETKLTARQKIISTALYPTELTALWKDIKCDGRGLLKLEAANLEEEAAAIAFILREALEEKEKTVLIVTNNRALAKRITAKMRIWDVEVNDSAGQGLAKLPTSTYLLEMVEMLRSQQSPVEVLSFFKHPFIPVEYKNTIREIEEKKLRGPRPEGFDVARHGLNFPSLSALGELFKKDEVSLAELFDLHIKCAEEIVAEDIIWGREGAEVKEFLAEFRDSVNENHMVDPELYPEILAQFLLTKTYRPKFGLHPRINILSPAEARMQSADLVILAGMNEGGFPPLPEADSFMNQQIRKKIGLDMLSRSIGQSAHDFELLSQAERVIYSRSGKEGGSPTVKSRFMQRLEAICDIEVAEKYLEWARAFYQPREIKAAPRPEPRPPVEARPKKLSATKVGKLMRDPYVVYAEKILRLKKLPPVDEEITANKFGDFIHQSLEEFSKNYDGRLETLINIGREKFAPYENFVGVKTFWWPKFVNIAAWFISHEKEIRRPELRQEFEVTGSYTRAGMEFTATADRVDIDGGVRVIDYKTGTPPSYSHVEAGLDPQLAIEAIIFSEQFNKPVEGLEYWYLVGRDEVVIKKPYKGDAKELVESARKGLAELAARFMKEDTPYLARPWSLYALKYNDYEHLERIKEWGDE